MDVLNRLSLNARVMDKIIKLFYKSVVLYERSVKIRRKRQKTSSS